MVLHYSAETNIKVSNGRSVMHQKTQQVPETEGSVDEPLSANGSQNWTLLKSRENEALMESQAVSAWAKTHTLHSPYHIVFSLASPGALSSQNQKSCMDGLPL